MRYETYNFSDDFQDALIKCLLFYPDKFGSIGDIIQPGFFNGVEAMDVVVAIRDYEQEFGKYPTFATLSNYMFLRNERQNPKLAERMVEYIAKIEQTDIGDWEYIRKMAVKFAKERAIFYAINEIGKEQTEPGARRDPVELMEKAMSVGQSLEDDGIELGLDGEKVIREAASKDMGIRPGMQHLDDVWPYGWQPGWLVTVLAPPKRYKTTFCLNIALNVACKQPHCDVLYYACEISQSLACMRTIHALTETTQEDLMSAKGIENVVGIFKKEWRKRVKSRVWFMHYPSKQANVNTIKRHARRIINQYGLTPKAIVIDYAETVRPNMKDKNAPDWRQSADVYTDARAMAEALNCVVIMPDRCNANTVGKKVPSMKSFQGAFEKAGIVDVGIGLCATGKEHKANILRTFVFLNRHGEEGGHFEGLVEAGRYKIRMTKVAEYVDPYDDEENSASGSSGGRGRRRKSNDDDDGVTRQQYDRFLDEEKKKGATTEDDDD